MTPKQKAKEIVLKFWNVPIHSSVVVDGVIIVETDRRLYESDAKTMATISVNEIIESNTSCVDCAEEGSIEVAWWGKVKREIELLQQR